MIDLTAAKYCIKVQRENGTYEGAKIGRIAKRCNGLVGSYRTGEIVLFAKGSREMRSQPRTVTVESPLCQEDITKESARGSLITTVRTTVGVPVEYIEEVKF